WCWSRTTGSSPGAAREWCGWMRGARCEGAAARTADARARVALGRARRAAARAHRRGRRPHRRRLSREPHQRRGRASGEHGAGGRVGCGGLFGGGRTRIDGFRAWLTAHKGPGGRLRDITEASPQIRNAVQRAGRFLSLASLVSVLLCAIAVAMAARAYVRRHLDTVALLKTLGATRSFTLTVSVLQLLALALAALALGAALGFLAQEWLLRT